MITLGTCIPLNARISQRQCDINRKGLPYKPAKPGQPAQPQRPPCLSCAGCPGLSSLQTADLQLIIVSKPVDTAPVEALVPVLPLAPKKRGGGTQKPAKTPKTALPEVPLMPLQLQQQILNRTMAMLQTKRQTRTR